MSFICHNGKFQDREQPLFTVRNRAFAYGDALFETMRARNGHLPFLAGHLHRLLAGMNTLGMDSGYLPDATAVMSYAQELMRRNVISGDARVRLTVFRDDGGSYLPERNSCGFVLEADSIPPPAWPGKGLRVGLQEGAAIPPSPLSPFKGPHNAYYIMAARTARALGLDDLLLLDTNGRITEAVSSSVVVVHGDTFTTPPRGVGNVTGTTLQALSGAMNGHKPIREAPVTHDMLMDADEMFLTNAIDAVRWVASCGEKRYSCVQSKRLFDRFLLLLG